MSDKQSTAPEPDWKAIAQELTQRVIFAIEHGKYGSGMLLNMSTHETQSVKDWLADGLEMIPGMKVNRELMHMTPSQRRKAAQPKGK